MNSFDADLLEELEIFIKNSDENILFSRENFLNYHGDRFLDASILSSDQGVLTYFPASKLGSEVVSHAGCTYGGLLITGKFTAEKINKVYQNIISLYVQEGVTKLTIKLAPKGFKSIESDMEAWVLFNLGFEVERYDLWNVLDAADLSFSSQHKRNLKKFTHGSFNICQDWGYLTDFYDILKNNLLDRYGVSPVHTLEDLNNLKHRLGNKLFLRVAVDPFGVVLGGIICFQLRSRLIHAQYIAASDQGKRNFVIDGIFHNCYLSLKNNERLSYGGSLVGTNHNHSLLRHKHQMGGKPVGQFVVTKHLNV